jgi:hypothetical protein
LASPETDRGRDEAHQDAERKGPEADADGDEPLGCAKRGRLEKGAEDFDHEDLHPSRHDDDADENVVGQNAFKNVPLVADAARVDFVEDLASVIVACKHVVKEKVVSKNK